MDQLQLYSKIDIPFKSAELIIHNPTIKEISYIEEKDFFKGCEYLNFSKDRLEQKDKNNLQ